MNSAAENYKLINEMNSIDEMIINYYKKINENKHKIYNLKLNIKLKTKKKKIL